MKTVENVSVGSKKSGRSVKPAVGAAVTTMGAAMGAAMAKAVEAKAGGAVEVPPPQAVAQLVNSVALVPVSEVETGLEKLPPMVKLEVTRQTKNGDTRVSTDFALTGIASRFTLGKSKSGRLTGGIETIGEYCLRKTTDEHHVHGRAFNDGHAKQALKDHPEWGKLPIVSKDEAKVLGKELDGIRQAFYSELKPAAIALSMDARTEVRKVRLVKTAKGVVMTTQAFIKAPQVSAESVLRAENEELKKRLAAIEALVPKKLVAKAQAMAAEAPVIELAPAAPAVEAPIPQAELAPVVTG